MDDPPVQILSRAAAASATEIQLHDDGDTSLIRHSDVAAGRYVLRRTRVHPSLASLQRLQHEFLLRERLQTSWATVPYALVATDERQELRMTDPGGAVLEHAIGEPWEIERFLRVAVGVAEALRRSHDAGLVHRDLRPVNVFVDMSSGRAWLSGFANAAASYGNLSTASGSEEGPGTSALSHASPEISGRINHSVDSRSDLYSLGVLFYQLLTGRLPFLSTDARELIHAHLAKPPQAPTTIVEGVPPMLERIVLKLLSKAAEDRYQSAAGVEADLRLSMHAWSTRRQIDDFVLASSESRSRLRVPERLYGRDRELAALRNALTKAASQDRVKIVLLSGYSGIGKSALVAEFQRSVPAGSGFFASGKADQYRSEVPHATLAQALQALVKPLLALPPIEREAWQTRLNEAVLANGRIIANMAPQLLELLGPQQSLPDLSPRDHQVQFQTTLTRFLKVFGSEPLPFILFLDDLQWTDSATLESIDHALLAESGLKLLLICAYRSNEIESNRPLAAWLERLRTRMADVEEIFLAPLLAGEIGNLVGDTLARTPETCAEVAQLVYRASAGNPFFATQFISGLSDEGLFERRNDSGDWVWDVARLRIHSHQADLPALMIERIRKLPATTRKAVKLLACLGIRSPAATLAHVAGSTQDDLHEALWPAVIGGLCLRSPGEYRFLHDRVQEAAYAMIPHDRRAAEHLEIARRLRGMAMAASDRTGDAGGFDLVRQFNLGAVALGSQAERDEVAGLNLKAARNALTATAHAAARGFAKAGIGLLGPEGHVRQRRISFELELTCAESDFLAGLVEPAERALRRLIRGERTPLESAAIGGRLIELYVVSSRYTEAAEQTVSCLKRLGVDIDLHPPVEEVDRTFAETMALLSTRPIEGLVDLPVSSDPEVAAAMKVLGEIFSFSYFTDAGLVVMHLCRMVRLTLQHGLTPASAQGFAWFGVMIGQHFGRYLEGYRFAELARCIVDKHGFAASEAKTVLALQLASVWAKPISVAVDTGRAALAAGMDRGDIAVACWACHHTVNDLLVRGDRLEDVAREIEGHLEFVRRAQFRDVVDELVTQQRFVAALRGLTPELGTFDGEGFEEAEFESSLVDGRMPTLAFWYWVFKGQLRFIAGRFEEAREALRKATPWMSSAVQSQLVNYHLYSALAAGAGTGISTPKARALTCATVMAHLQRLRAWRVCNPATFADKSELVEAELARCEGRDLDAELHFEEAVRLARANACTWTEALANEMAARFHAARGLASVAQTYLRQAHSAYIRWDAGGKVKVIERENPWLFENAPVGAVDPSRTFVGSLDLETVIAVSEAISSEIDSERLIETLMRVALEHAGAQRGLLFLRGPGGMQFEAQAEVLGESVRVARSDGMNPEVPRPASVLEIVTKKLQAVLLDNACHSPDHAGETYFQQRGTRSVLCLPLLEQARLAGVLYLENDLITGAFTSKRIAVLRLVAAQAAIALEKARLYRELKRENHERQLAEESAERTARALRESEGRFRAMVDATPDVIWIMETEPERVLYASPSFERIWGVSLERLYQDPRLWMEGIHPDDRSGVRAAFGEWVLSDGRAGWNVEFRVLPPSGCIRWIHERGVFLREESNGPRRVSGISSDVTEQRSAVLALQQSERRHSLAMEAARDGHWDWIAETDEYYASPRMLEIYGFPPDTRFNGRQDFLERFPFHPDDRPRWEAAVAEHFASGRSRFEIELRLLRHGEVRWIHTNGLLSRDDQGRPRRYTGSVSDITERKAGEAALRESEERFALATEGSNDGLWDWDMRTDRMFLSHRAQHLYGLEHGALIRPRAEWGAMVSLHPDDEQRQNQLLRDYLDRQVASYDSEWRILHPDGVYRWIRLRGVCLRDDEGQPTRMAGSVSDVDARRRTEAAIQQMQRLEAVGTLAGGVAHDFNNILAVILGFGEASMKNTRPGSRMRRDLERILSAGERGRALVERILTFSRSSVGARVVVHVESVVAESLAMLEAMRPSHVEVTARLGSGSATMIGDPTQVHQLLMNLATNGIQAMRSSGCLKIELSCASIQEERMATTGPLAPGDYIVLSVRDNGAGIDPSIRDRIFDPFFTTKDVGTGTGLGLSLVHGIVTELGGAIDVSTELDVGSCFNAYLPRAGERAAPYEQRSVPAARGNNERVLIVDDEEPLVQLTSDMLSELGYRPAAYTSAELAVEALRQDAGSFDAIITDFRMPHMSGMEFIDAVRGLDVKVPILLMSGFLAGSTAEKARKLGADVILAKPLSRRDLALALSDALRVVPRSEPAS
ncbi:PAS domain-containing protein [Variovorax sp. J31P207]|uniref:PAS domain-containing protein n=1 Tax=Variovorax sp. J31P207 TaxID=3053510 RepID=UPI00257802ED|nr:PAS domain-containing protein [Variovorax sp. J31P207]MDM0066295.1 PAS domain-containing protein [Variovorax sp. J31P207]